MSGLVFLGRLDYPHIFREYEKDNNGETAKTVFMKFFISVI